MSTEPQLSEPKLGDRVREIVTGVTHYEGHNGKPESTWWDVGRLLVVERDAIAPIRHAPDLGGETPPPAR